MVHGSGNFVDFSNDYRDVYVGNEPGTRKRNRHHRAAKRYTGKKNTSLLLANSFHFGPSHFSTSLSDYLSPGWFFDLPIVGNLLTLFGLASVYLISVLGLGLFISTVSDTQQQVMFISFFFMMIFILMGGIFTPVESMPHWAQMIDRANPIYYFMRIMRHVVLKGSGFFRSAGRVYFVADFR